MMMSDFRPEVERPRNAESINSFNFILIDVGHHLGIGRVSRSSLVARACWAIERLPLLSIGGQSVSAARWLARQSSSCCWCEHTSSSHVKDV